MGEHCSFSYCHYSFVVTRTKFNYFAKMKLIIIALALVAMVACAEVQQDFFCSSDAECDSGCCTKVGVCSKYVEENGLCAIRSKVACGCQPGLTCVKTSFLIKRCRDMNPGSGGF